MEFRLGRITVVQGPNAAGKTNVYRALRLLSRGAGGELARAVLAEGGMPSMLWAGERSRSRTAKPVRLTVGVKVGDLSYELAMGLPVGPIEADHESELPSRLVHRLVVGERGGRRPFVLDGEVKEERAWFGSKVTRHTTLLDRGARSATARTDDELVTFAATLDPSELILGQVGEPGRFPELFDVREQLRRWRFYHSFPTNDDASARAVQMGVRTPVLADDGRDLAAAIATIDDMGGGPALRDAVRHALDAELVVDVEPTRGTFAVALAVPGVRRPMTAAELSDGTLRFLCLATALLSPRPPQLLVLNEPETSLHAGVAEALAGLVVGAAEHSQVAAQRGSLPGDIERVLCCRPSPRPAHAEQRDEDRGDVGEVVAGVGEPAKRVGDEPEDHLDDNDRGVQHRRDRQAVLAPAAQRPSPGQPASWRLCRGSRGRSLTSGAVHDGQQQSAHVSPCQASRPSWTASAAISSPAIGSAHHQLRVVLATSPASSTADR